MTTLLRLPGILMNSEHFQHQHPGDGHQYYDVDDEEHKNDHHHQHHHHHRNHQHQYQDSMLHMNRLPDEIAWARSLTLTGTGTSTVKRTAASYPFEAQVHTAYDVVKQQRQLQRYPGFDRILSPPQRKRQRGGSDTSPFYGTRSPARPPPPPQPLQQAGIVHVTSTSIRALGLLERSHNTNATSYSGYDSSHRKSVPFFDDYDSSARDSFGGLSSHGSGRDSMSSTHTVDDHHQQQHQHQHQQQQQFHETATGTASITNASRNITFAMLQDHFAKPLKDAANYYGVCTTLLKKVCRKNGILSWPYRQIIGLQKSIASMEQQVHYFDGDQRRQYAEQLRKLQFKLDSFIQTGKAPAEEELVAMLRTDGHQGTTNHAITATAAAAAAPSPPARLAAPYTFTTRAHNSVVRPAVNDPSQEYYGEYHTNASVVAVSVESDELQRCQGHHTRPSPTRQSAYGHRQADAEPQPHYFAGAGTAPYGQGPLPSLSYILKQQTHPTAAEMREDHHHHHHHYDHLYPPQQ